MPTDPRLHELDDAFDDPPESASGVERITAPAPFELGVFAKEIEGAESRVTLPPTPAYEMLRDSCRAMVASPSLELELEEDDLVPAPTATPLPVGAQSQMKMRIPPPLPKR